MPTRPGYDQLSLQLPKGMRAALDEARGDTPANVFICGLIAAACGVGYSPPPRGAAAHKKKPRKPRKEK